MKKLAAIIIFAFGLCPAANADIWKWVDAYGKTHFVDTNTPIFTWLDESGKVHYSDRPEHKSAVSIELVWHSTDVLADKQDRNDSAVASRGKQIDPDETGDERLEREAAEAYYCKRAREIYDSYLKAPQLYNTNEDGEREYLTEEQKQATLADTEAKVVQLCN